MKHLYQNSDGELVAADSAEQASRHYDSDLGGDPEPRADEWDEVDDAARVPIRNAGENGETLTKTAKEWAEECDEPEVVASTYD